MNSNQATGERHIMIVAGEASGDMHGAALVRAMQAADPGLTFSGIGGQELSRAGVDIFFDAAKIAVVGLTEVISHFGDIHSARSSLLKRARERKPALLILIDFPGFNLRIAATAKKLGIPVFYYISPQIWAWHTSRVHKIGRLADRIGVILPFEKEFYANYGINVDYVGNPLVDSTVATLSREAFLRRLDISPDKKVIALIPGSRQKEVRGLFPDFLAAAASLAAAEPESYVFLIPQAPTVTRQQLDESGLTAYGDQLDFRVITENRYDMMAACDAAVAASGTITLELALLGTPAVITYRVSPLTYCLGKLLIRKISFFSLPNLIADKEVIPELLQDEVTPERLALELTRLINDKNHSAAVLNGLREVRERLGPPGASQRAAAVAIEAIV